MKKNVILGLVLFVIISMVPGCGAESNKQNSLTPSDDAVISGIKYQIKAAKESKKLMAYTVAKVDFSELGKDVSHDDQGTLSDNNSYIYVNIELKNQNSSQTQIYLNTMEITTQDLSEAFPPVAFNKSQHPDDAKKIAEYTMDANEKEEFQLLFVVPDATLKKDLCIQLNPFGYGKGDINSDDVKYLKLNIIQ